MASSTWQQSLIDMSGGTAPTWQQAIQNMGNAETRVLTVGAEGAMHTTTQEAIDAAMVAGKHDLLSDYLFASVGVKILAGHTTTNVDKLIVSCYTALPETLVGSELTMTAVNTRSGSNYQVKGGINAVTLQAKEISETFTATPLAHVTSTYSGDTVTFTAAAGYYVRVDLRGVLDHSLLCNQTGALVLGDDYYPHTIYVDQTGIINHTAPIPAGINIVHINDAPSPRQYPRPFVPYTEHMVSIVFARPYRNYIDVQSTGSGNNVFTDDDGPATHISAAQYCARRGIPISICLQHEHQRRGELQGHYPDSYADSFLSVHDLKILCWTKGDCLMTGTGRLNYGADRLPQNFRTSVLGARRAVEALSSGWYTSSNWAAGGAGDYNVGERLRYTDYKVYRVLAKPQATTMTAAVKGTSGGNGYYAGDILTVVGITGGTGTVTVSTVSAPGGAVTAVTFLSGGLNYDPYACTDLATTNATHPAASGCQVTATVAGLPPTNAANATKFLHDAEWDAITSVPNGWTASSFVPNGVTANDSAVLTADEFKQLGVRCIGYAEAGGATESQPTGEPYNVPPGRVYSAHRGWYGETLKEVFDYSMIHGDACDGGASEQGNPLIGWSYPISTPTEAASPRTYAPGGRTNMAVEGLGVWPFADFKTVIDNLCTLRDQGKITFVTADTLARGIRQPMRDMVTTGEVVTVTNDAGTLFSVPKQVLAVHGTVGTTPNFYSTDFAVVAAGKTLLAAGTSGKGECHIDYTTGVITFHADDNPTSVTVDYIPANPPWAGVREWHFANMGDGALSTNTLRQYGWGPDLKIGGTGVDPGNVPTIASHQLILTTGQGGVTFSPPVMEGEAYVVRIKAQSSAGTQRLRLRTAWYTYESTCDPDTWDGVTVKGVATGHSFNAYPLDSAMITNTSEWKYYYFNVRVPLGMNNFWLTMWSTVTGSVTIDSIEWAVC